MKLWLVRHAQPLIASGICYGATDVAADGQATQQVARVLAKLLPERVRVLSSPLQRCEDLARFLKKLRPDLTYETDARLTEMDFGRWEGQRWDAIAPADIERWTDAFGNHCVGGAESVDQFMQRVGGVWDATRREGIDAVWITHAGVIRAATLLAQGVRQVEQAAQWPRDAPAFGGWNELQF